MMAPALRLRELVDVVTGSVTPDPGSKYEVYSVPAFDSKSPEVLLGGEIKSSKRPVASGDVLVCKINPRINRVWVVGSKKELPQIASTEWFALRCRSSILPMYVAHLLGSPAARHVIEESVSGATGSHTRARIDEVLEIEIPVPPLAEQQRIVAKLDEVDADLRTLSERLDTELLRTAQVRLSAVDELFNNIAASERPLAAVCDVFADGDWIESKDQSNAGIRLVQTGNVGDGVFKDRRDKARWIDENTFSRLNCTEVVPGDILFSRLPDPVGRACMIPDTGDRMITAVDCTIARPSEKVVDPEFIVLFASSSRYFAQVRSMITGTTRDRISRKNLGDVPIPVPTLSEQKQIVLKAREIDSLCAEVSENIERRKDKAGELRQSVLAAAFRGDL